MLKDKWMNHNDPWLGLCLSLKPGVPFYSLKQYLLVAYTYKQTAEKEEDEEDYTSRKH